MPVRRPLDAGSATGAPTRHASSGSTCRSRRRRASGTARWTSELTGRASIIDAKLSIIITDFLHSLPEASPRHARVVMHDACSQTDFDYGANDAGAPAHAAAGAGEAAPPPPLPRDRPPLDTGIASNRGPRCLESHVSPPVEENLHLESLATLVHVEGGAAGDSPEDPPHQDRGAELGDVPAGSRTRRAKRRLRAVTSNESEGKPRAKVASADPPAPDTDGTMAAFQLSKVPPAEDMLDPMEVLGVIAKLATEIPRGSVLQSKLLAVFEERFAESGSQLDLALQALLRTGRIQVMSLKGNRLYRIA